MLVKNTFKNVIIIIFFFYLLSCGGGGGDSNVPTPPSPGVTSTVPAQSGNNISISSLISITFNIDVLDNFVASRFKVFKYQGPNPVPVPISAKSISYNSPTKTATFVPEIDLTPSSKFRVVLYDITDKAGKIINREYSWDFTTAGAPSIIYASVRDDDYIEQKPVIKITFSELVKESSLVGNILLDDVVLPINSTTFSMDTFTFTPPKTYLTGSTHQLIVKTGVTDLSGDPLKVQLDITFIILPAPPLTVTALQNTTQTTDPEFVFVLNRSVDETSLKNSISISKVATAGDPNPKNIPLSVNYNSQFQSVVVSFQSPVPVGDYNVNIDISLKDQNGVTLPEIFSSTLSVTDKSWNKIRVIADLTTKYPEIVFERGFNGGKTVAWSNNNEILQKFYSLATKTWGPSISITGKVKLASNETLNWINTKIDKNGNAVTTWVQNTKISTMENTASIWVNNYIDGQWQTPKKLVTANNLFEYEFTTSTNGDAFVIWSSYSNTNQITDVQFSQYINGKTWTAPTSLDRTMGQDIPGQITHTFKKVENIFLDKNGNGLIIWRGNREENLLGSKTRNDQIFYTNRITSTGVQAPIFNSSIKTTFTGIDSFSPIKVVNNNNGDAIVAWVDYTNPSIVDKTKISVFTMRYSGGFWTTPEVHDTVANTSLIINGSITRTEKSTKIYLYLISNRLGNTVLAWHQNDSTKIFNLADESLRSETIIRNSKAKYFNPENSNTLWSGFVQLSSNASIYPRLKFYNDLISPNGKVTIFEEDINLKIQTVHRYSPLTNTWATTTTVPGWIINRTYSRLNYATENSFVQFKIGSILIDNSNPALPITKSVLYSTDYNF